MIGLVIPPGAFNRLSHRDCMVAGIPIQVMPPSMKYVFSSDASYPCLQRPNR